MNYEKAYDEAEAFYIDQKFKKALNLFRKIDGMKDNGDCLNYIGCCFIELNKFDEAKSCFIELINKYPKWARPYYNMGRVYQKLNDNKNALKYFNRAKIIDPYDEDIYYYIGNYYLSIKKYKIAERYYIKSINLDLEQYESHLNLGICYLERKIFNKALIEFDIAFQINQNCYSALLNQGYIYYIMEKYSDAMNKYLYLHNLFPKNIEYIMNIIKCLYKAKNYSEALAWNSKILDIKPEDKTARIVFNKLTKML